MISPIQLLLKHIPADYTWDDENIVRIGRSKDIAAYAAGDFKGPCLIFCHGNGETAVSEKYWFNKLVEAGISVLCPDYRGYGLTEGRLSEAGCCMPNMRSRVPRVIVVAIMIVVLFLMKVESYN